MITSLHILNTFLDDQLNQLDQTNKNLDKQNECIKRYHDAKNLPRKQKKRERRLAHRDYSFWKSIGDWQINTFKI
jgi:hypothetical protein